MQRSNILCDAELYWNALIFENTTESESRSLGGGICKEHISSLVNLVNLLNAIEFGYLLC